MESPKNQLPWDRAAIRYQEDRTNYEGLQAHHIPQKVSERIKKQRSPLTYILGKISLPKPLVVREKTGPQRPPKQITKLSHLTRWTPRRLYNKDNTYARFDYYNHQLQCIEIAEHLRKCKKHKNPFVQSKDYRLSPIPPHHFTLEEAWGYLLTLNELLPPSDKLDDPTLSYQVFLWCTHLRFPRHITPAHFLWWRPYLVNPSTNDKYKINWDHVYPNRKITRKDKERMQNNRFHRIRFRIETRLISLPFYRHFYKKHIRRRSLEILPIELDVPYWRSVFNHPEYYFPLKQKYQLNNRHALRLPLPANLYRYAPSRQIRRWDYERERKENQKTKYIKLYECKGSEGFVDGRADYIITTYRLSELVTKSHRREHRYYSHEYVFSRDNKLLSAWDPTLRKPREIIDISTNPNELPQIYSYRTTKNDLPFEVVYAYYERSITSPPRAIILQIIDIQANVDIYPKVKRWEIRHYHPCFFHTDTGSQLQHLWLPSLRSLALQDAHFKHRSTSPTKHAAIHLMAHKQESIFLRKAAPNSSEEEYISKYFDPIRIPRDHPDAIKYVSLADVS